MEIKKIIAGTIALVGFVASIITIGDFIGRRFNHDQNKQDNTTITIDEPTVKVSKERTYIGQLWHDAFSDERIPVKERWETRKERYYELDSVFHRIAFWLFYFPIAGIIILLLSCIVAPIIGAYILDDDDFRSMDGIISLFLGFIGAYILIDGTYTIIVWFLP